MPATPPSFLLRFRRAISDFQHDRYAQREEAGPIIGVQDEGVNRVEEAAAPQRREGEARELQAVEKRVVAAAQQASGVETLAADALPDRTRQNAAPVASAVMSTSSETTESSRSQLNGTSRLQEWQTAPPVVARQRKPIDISEPRSAGIVSVPQPPPNNAMHQVATTIEAPEAEKTKSNGNPSRPDRESPAPTSKSLPRAKEIKESEPAGIATAPKSAPIGSPRGNDLPANDFSNAPETVTNRVQTSEEVKLPPQVASSQVNRVAMKATESLPEPMPIPREVRPAQVETTVEQILSEVARTTDTPVNPADVAQESKATAANAPMRKPSDVLELRPDPEYPSILDRTMTMGSESFSILRSRLLNVNASLGIRTVLIISAETEEGKTLIAMNLAISLGQLGKKRILLVDGDLRKRTITETLKLSNARGLSDFLQGNTPFAKVIQATNIPTLSIVGAGQAAEGTLPEILEGPRWREFLDAAKESFDLILVDSVPAGAPVADCELLMAPCDAALMVVRLFKSTREGVARAMQRIDSKRLLGIILNNSDQTHRSKYYGYYGGHKVKT